MSTEERKESDNSLPSSDVSDSLKQQVEYMRIRFPEKYMKHQAIGESIMSCSFETVAGVDDEGDLIKAKSLIYAVRDYDMEDDLSSEELNLLLRVYGVEWRKKMEGL